MTCQKDKIDKLVRLVDHLTPREGVINETRIRSLSTFKSTQPNTKVPYIYEPVILIAIQGKTSVYVGNEKYQYGVGRFLTLLLPMPVEAEIIEASIEKPLVCVGIRIDQDRLADLILKIERSEETTIKPAVSDSSGIFTARLNNKLLDATVRLVESLSNPRDASILSEMIIDEIYYYILCSEHGNDLRILLQQRGQIQRISKAVQHIHQNLHEPVSVENLARMANLSRTRFYENFREVMHLSPLQYAKSIKLHRAQTLILKGNSASEAGYQVGYNSPAQFSREYKRHFGFTPSETI